MNSILAILFFLGALGLGLWVAWNVLEVVYKLVMIAILGMGYVLLTIWEILVLKPATLVRNLLKK